MKKRSAYEKHILWIKTDTKTTHTHSAFNSSAGINCTKVVFLCDTQLHQQLSENVLSADCWQLGLQKHVNAHLFAYTRPDVIEQIIFRIINTERKRWKVWTRIDFRLKAEKCNIGPGPGNKMTSRREQVNRRAKEPLRLDRFIFLLYWHQYQQHSVFKAP